MRVALSTLQPAWGRIAAVAVRSANPKGPGGVAFGGLRAGAGDLLDQIGRPNIVAAVAEAGEDEAGAWASRGAECGEGGNGIGEEHNAVARDDEVGGWELRDHRDGVAMMEGDGAAVADAGARRLDQVGGQVEAGDGGVGAGVGEREAGGAGAAADVDRVEGAGGGGAADCGVEMRGQVGEGTVGSLPFGGPGAADAAGPVCGGGHGVGPVVMGWAHVCPLLRVTPDVFRGPPSRGGEA